MRIVDRSLYIRFLNGLAENRNRSSGALNSLGDGKRVRIGSDNPAGVRESLHLRAHVTRLAGIDRAAQSARADLAALDGALADTIDRLVEARNEALAGASNVDQEDATRAVVVERVREQLLDLANLNQRGRYLFAGTETLTEPFADDGTYAGNDAEALVPYDTTAEVGATLSGRRVFLDGGDVLATLDDLAQALRDGRSDDVEAAIPTLNGAIDHIIDLRGEIGERMTRLDDAFVRHADQSVAALERISQIEDADLSQVIVDLQSASNATDALSAAAARVLGRSLFDFIG